MGQWVGFCEVMIMLYIMNTMENVLWMPSMSLFLD